MLTNSDSHPTPPLVIRLEHPRRHPAVPQRPEGWYHSVKAVLDFGCALALLVLAAPLILLAALAVKLTSRGPVFYSQVRLGRGGRPYTIHKIRTMRHDCEKHTGALEHSGRQPHHPRRPLSAQDAH